MAATETARERKARREQMERERLEDRRRLALNLARALFAIGTD